MSSVSTSGMEHDHSFCQDQVRSGERRTLIVILITAAMMVTEIVTGVMFGSMALLADGLHMGSHATALGITFFAYIYARRRAHDRRFTFGTGKVNALAGFTGAVLLAVFALFMAYESIHRLLSPVEIAFNSAILVAVIGLIVNGGCVFILNDPSHHHHDHGHHDHNNHDHHHEDHNLRSAYLHVLADALTSVLAIFALLSGKYFGWMWMDPIMGVVGAILVARWSVGLLKASAKVLLDHQAPKPIVDSLVRHVENDGDCKVTDVHVWSIGPSIYAAELTVAGPQGYSAGEYRQRIPKELGLVHVTIETRSS